MCKACKLDSREVRSREFRQGGYGVEDFADTFRRPPARKGKPRRTRPGCIGNDGGSHVFIWTTEREEPDLFFEHYGFHRMEGRICVGCGKRRGSRHSEKYERVKARKWKAMYGDTGVGVKRGCPIPRRGGSRIDYNYWRWESHDSAYVEKRRRAYERMGYSNYIFGRYL